MRKIVFLSTLVLLALNTTQAQLKPDIAKQNTPAPSALKKMLSGSGLPFKLVNDSVAVVPYEGENIASYSVVVQAASDLYIVFVNLTEALPGKMTESTFKYLLQRNNDFDLIKIGLDDNDDTVYLRADVYKTMMSPALMTRIIKQVANVANIVGGDMK